jgi:hypothetical protein
VLQIGVTKCIKMWSNVPFCKNATPEKSAKLFKTLGFITPRSGVQLSLSPQKPVPFFGAGFFFAA